MERQRNEEWLVLVFCVVTLITAFYLAVAPGCKAKATMTTEVSPEIHAALVQAEADVEAVGNRVASVEASVGDIRSEIGDITTTVGGGADSVSSWIALVSTGAVSVISALGIYIGILRPMRHRKESRNGTVWH